MIYKGEPVTPQTDWGNYGTYGLTKREYFAAKAMVGYLAAYPSESLPDPNKMASMAVKYADALIEELNNTE